VGLFVTWLPASSGDAVTGMDRMFGLPEEDDDDS
jgi:hypothetical protein